MKFQILKISNPPLSCTQMRLFQNGRFVLTSFVMEVKRVQK